MIILSICLLVILKYIFIIRPLHLKWGATRREVEFSLSGDEILKKTDFNATRGITIESTADEIWKWII